MVELYPEFSFDTEDIMASFDKKEKPQYVPSCYFDFEKGDFATDGRGAIQHCEGVEAWKQWCIKTICTTRFACLAYSGEIGIERQRLKSLSSYASVCLALEKEITEALMADPAGRTYSVSDFSFDNQGDRILVTCKVMGKEQQQIELSVEV